MVCMNMSGERNDCHLLSTQHTGATALASDPMHVTVSMH